MLTPIDPEPNWSGKQAGQSSNDIDSGSQHIPSRVAKSCNRESSLLEPTVRGVVYNPRHKRDRGERSHDISTIDMNPALIRGNVSTAFPLGKKGRDKRKLKVAGEYACTNCGMLFTILLGGKAQLALGHCVMHVEYAGPRKRKRSPATDGVRQLTSRSSFRSLNLPCYRYF